MASRGQHPVAGAAQPGEVIRPAARHITGAFDEVVFMLERSDEPADLLGVHAAVAVEHDDDVAGGCSESGPHGVALAGAGFGDHHDVQAQGPGDVDGAVQGTAVDNYHLIHI